jgi:hypothetical protein
MAPPSIPKAGHMPYMQTGTSKSIGKPPVRSSGGAYQNAYGNRRENTGEPKRTTSKKFTKNTNRFGPRGYSNISNITRNVQQNKLSYKDKETIMQSIFGGQ